jgi:hypothetical protein
VGEMMDGWMKVACEFLVADIQFLAFSFFLLALVVEIEIEKRNQWCNQSGERD